MNRLSLSYPNGRPFAPSALVRRQRPLPPNASVLLVSVGEQVRPDQPIAESPGAEGKRRAVLAGMTGKVVDVAPGRWVTIEGAATLVHGVLGLGGPVAGPFARLPRGDSPLVAPIIPGSILIIPGQLRLTVMQRAAAGGAVGIIAGSAQARELEAFARADLSVLLDDLVPSAASLPLTVMLTEGLGSASMNATAQQLLAQRGNDIVLLSGYTEPHRNLRPEVAMPLPLGSPTHPLPLDGVISAGARVYVIAGERAGGHGVVTHVFARRQFIANGLLVPCAMLRFDDGTTAMEPLHTLQRIG